MKAFPRLLSACLMLLPAAAQVKPALADWSAAQAKIGEWQRQAGAAKEQAKPLLRVVYFHGKDRQPLPDYQARLTRVMDDISHFYRDGLKDCGIASDGLPLEKDGEGKLVLHMVQGQHESAHYNYESGGETEAEIRKALAGKIDLDREFVLILYGQCWEIPDGRWGFYSPYYGKPGSCQRWGLCHAADCQFLDPQLLTEKTKRLRYWEHYGDRDQSMAEFNSFYLGGIAHELGHGLGLPHDCESPKENGERGISLMGSGNLTYRNNLWKPGARESYLSIASAVRLASHPLVTGSHAGRFEAAAGSFTGLEISGEGREIELRGKVTAKIPAYAVMVYVDPPGRSDYNARTWVVPVTDGSFDLEGVEVPAEDVDLRLVACHMNGETTGISAKVPRGPGVDHKALAANFSRSKLDVLEAAVAIGDPRAAAMVAKLKEQAADAISQKKLTVLEALLKPAAPLVDLTTTELDSCYLSDAAWQDAKSGWAGTPRDKWGAPPEYRQGIFLSIAGELQAKGLPAHCPASHVFTTAGRWKKLQATVGIRDGAGPGARAIFIVKGDGKELYRSEQLAEGKAANVEVDISGVKELTLLTESGLPQNHTCWAVWGVPEVKR